MAKKEKAPKLTKEEKKAAKAEKKANQTPEQIETKNTIIKSVTAVICAAAVCLSATTAVGNYSEAMKKAAEINASVAPVYQQGGTQTGGTATDDSGSVSTGDSTTTDTPATDEGTATTDAASDAGSTTPSTPTGGNSSTPAADSKGLNSTDPAAVAAFYNKAVHATEKSAPKGHQTMKLDGGITGDGALGAVLKVASPIIQSTLERNSTDTDYIPGHEADLLASDIKSCSAVSKGGVTTLTIQLKDQKDGPEADAHTAGPVARGIGTLGNVNGAIEELGAELYSGRETISLLYNDAYIKQLTIDENTGKITHGTWHYKVDVTVGNAEIKLGIKFTAKNLKACIDYAVVL